jgi:hypothetical protein
MKRAIAYAAGAMLVGFAGPAFAADDDTPAPQNRPGPAAADSRPVGRPINLYPAGGAPRPAHVAKAHTPSPAQQASAAPGIIPAVNQ